MRSWRRCWGPRLPRHRRRLLPLPGRLPPGHRWARAWPRTPPGSWRCRQSDTWCWRSPRPLHSRETTTTTATGAARMRPRRCRATFAPRTSPTTHCSSAPSTSPAVWRSRPRPTHPRTSPRRSSAAPPAPPTSPPLRRPCVSGTSSLVASAPLLTPLPLPRPGQPLDNGHAPVVVQPRLLESPPASAPTNQQLQQRQPR